MVTMRSISPPTNTIFHPTPVPPLEKLTYGRTGDRLRVNTCPRRVFPKKNTSPSCSSSITRASSPSPFNLKKGLDHSVIKKASKNFDIGQPSTIKPQEVPTLSSPSIAKEQPLLPPPTEKKSCCIADLFHWLYNAFAQFFHAIYLFFCGKEA